MRNIRFYVGLDQGEWTIKYGHRVIGPFASQDHAFTAAVDEAYRACDPTHESEVLVEDENHRFHTEWTCSQDPYPPGEWATLAGNASGTLRPGFELSLHEDARAPRSPHRRG